MYPKVSVVIPFYRDLDYFDQCLECLGRQSLDTSLFDIIIVDNHPEPYPVQSILSNLAYIHEPAPGSYNARNTALKNITGGIVAFTDADCLPDENWLERAVDFLQSCDETTIVGGEIKIFPADPEAPTLAEAYDMLLGLRQERFVKAYNFAATANMLVWRSAFDKVGYFNGKLKSGGDREWGMRAWRSGCCFVYCRDATVRHPARYSLREVMIKTRRVEGGLYESKLSGPGTNISFKDRVGLALESLNSIITAKNTGHIHKIGVLMMALFLFVLQMLEQFKLIMGGRSER